MVAGQFAAAAAAASSAPGAVARTRKPARRRGWMAIRMTGNVSSASGCVATAAPISQPDRPVLARDSTRMANSSNPTATASSG